MTGVRPILDAPHQRALSAEGATGTPKRIRLSRKAGFRLPETAVRVDRATAWGNPFRAMPAEDGRGGDAVAGLVEAWARGGVIRDEPLTWRRARAAVSLYELWLGCRMQDLRFWHSAALHETAMGELAAARWPLPPCDEEIREAMAGLDLACWCPLCEAHGDGRPADTPCADCPPCHADVLLERANPSLFITHRERSGT